MTTIISLRRAARAALLGVALLAAGSCSVADSLLEVDNPAQLNEDLLQDSALVKVLVGGVIGDFTTMYHDPFIWRGTMFTDEQVTGINWEQTARLNQRVIRFDENDADLMFAQISRARMQADSVAGRLKAGLSKDLTKDGNLALSLAYAGYSYIVMADAMCQATINVGAKIYEPLELYQIAVDRFKEALPIAQAVSSETLLNKRKGSDLVHMINVGLSRAYLNLGQASQAMAAAQGVPANFYWWVEYSDKDSRVYNVLESRTTGGNHALGVHPTFVAGGPSNFSKQNLESFLTDPRVQHEPKWTTGHNALTKLYKPKPGLMYSDYNGATFATGGKPAAFGRGTDIALASGIEALHNYYEAAGASGTGPQGSTLQFVNARRSFGKQAAVDLSGKALMDELRNQRGRDLFLGGNRLGDLRRWLRAGDNLFPTGNHPNEQWGAYGDATCFPIPKEEYEGNPNIKKPGS